MEKILTCDGCNAQCCRYVAIEIDTPEEIIDFENIKWYVSHKNVQVYICEDGSWNVEFLTSCEHLDDKNVCSIYEDRPDICREYHQGSCTFHNNYEEQHLFKSIEDVNTYINEIFKKGLHKIDEN